MALPVSFLEVAYLDYGNERGRWKVPVTTLTAGNYAAQKALIDALVAAAQTLVLGPLTEETIIIERDQMNTGPASNQAAQRENKWLCRYTDVIINKKFRCEIPTCDLTKLANNSEFLDLTGGDGATFKAAFEAVVKSPADATHTVSLDSVQFVGREA